MQRRCCNSNHIETKHSCGRLLLSHVCLMRHLFSLVHAAVKSVESVFAVSVAAFRSLLLSPPDFVRFEMNIKRLIHRICVRVCVQVFLERNESFLQRQIIHTHIHPCNSLLHRMSRWHGSAGVAAALHLSPSPDSIRASRMRCHSVVNGMSCRLVGLPCRCRVQCDRVSSSCSRSRRARCCRL